MLPGKCVLESRLKCAELGLADAKPGTDIRLGGTKKFDVDLCHIC